MEFSFFALLAMLLGLVALFVAVAGYITYRALKREKGGRERLVPVGGTGLALVNLDYRFPIAGALGGVAFIDVGNVWADWRDIDPGQAKVGAGVGIRYLSPLGPLRFEIGWKLDREPEEDSWVATFSVGNPF